MTNALTVDVLTVSEFTKLNDDIFERGESAGDVLSIICTLFMAGRSLSVLLIFVHSLWYFRR